MRFYTVIVALSLVAAVFAVPIANPEALPEPYLPPLKTFSNYIRVAEPVAEPVPSCPGGRAEMCD
jgi:hypothetical protein